LSARSSQVATIQERMAAEHSEAVEPLTLGDETRYWLRVRTMGAEAELKLLGALRSAWTSEASWGLDKVACTHVVDVIRSWGHYYVGVWVLPSCNKGDVTPAEYHVTQMDLSGRVRPGKPDIPQHPALPQLTEPICRAFFKVRSRTYAPPCLPRGLYHLPAQQRKPAHAYSTPSGDYLCLTSPRPGAHAAPSACGSCVLRRQGKHTRVHLLSALLRAKTPGDLTNESEVSSHGNRRISAFCAGGGVLGILSFGPKARLFRRRPRPSGIRQAPYDLGAARVC